ADTDHRIQHHRWHDSLHHERSALDFATVELMDTLKVRNASKRARVLSLDAPCRSRTANAFLLLQHTVLLFLLVFGLSSTSNTATALAQSSKKAGQPQAKPAKSTRYCRLDFQV